ncbi:MAG TPA: response regulator [Thermoanaerobaculia bacterium]|jgi:CheY-like chemotaxis protein|nr:response regulator [Thermoanaerobaculia bacterium]
MPKRILLADDSITIQKVVELTFSDGDYEVVAVNNGAKAIQRLSEMRPDIILSDIIMPEKNGYEVCEYVKSHPELRNIPVILLTGTFEPFDPDRADKAGCDAVVTKPFESQSLIQKVEELVQQAQAATAAIPAAAPAPQPEPAPSPWDDTPVAPSFDAPEPEHSPFSAGTTSAGFTATPFPANDNDIFGAAPSAPPATTEMPFETEQSGGDETRAFPRMSFEELQRMAAPPQPAPAREPESPWGTSAPSGGGETQAFPRVSFEDLQRAATPEPTSPWDEPAAAPTAEPAFGGETRAFPSVSFEDLQSASTPEPIPPTAEPSSPWDEPAAEPAFGGETRAFPSASFEELEQSAHVAEPEPEAAPEPRSPWDEQPAFQHEEVPAFQTAAEPAFPAEEPAFGGETRAFPRMSFEDLQQMQSASAPEPEPEAAPEPQSLWDEPAAPAWAPPEEPAAQEEPVSSFTAETASPFDEPRHEEAAAEEETPFAAGDELAPTEEPQAAAPAAEEAPAFEEPVWSPQAVPEPEPEPEPLAAEEPEPAPAAAAASADLTEDQIDRIARRVVQLMSDQVVRNIAWEVIPDLAEIVVKERIRQLEAE